MVMGFNSDIDFEGKIYHVQTEPRKDGGIDTTVYVKGAIVHKYKSSCEEVMKAPDFTEEKHKELLKDQHRLIVGRVRAGEIKAAPPANPA
jgi:hypothetical protein